MRDTYLLDRRRDFFVFDVILINPPFELVPDDAEVWSSLGSVLARQQRPAGAEKAFRKALELNPNDHETRHLLAALTGETVETAPAAYVAGLFDQAQLFQHLVDHQAERFELGTGQWVVARFTAEKPLPKTQWKKWLEESYALTAPAQK